MKETCTRCKRVVDENEPQIYLNGSYSCHQCYMKEKGLRFCGECGGLTSKPSKRRREALSADRDKR